MTPMKLRTTDKWGSGAFGASRGDHTHKGVDVETYEGQQILSPIKGIVTKIGRPYAAAEKAYLQYVEVSNGGYKFRFFYVQSVVAVNDEINIGDVLGVSQGLDKFYPGIIEHMHFEIMNGREYVDPTPIVLIMQSNNLTVLY